MAFRNMRGSFASIAAALTLSACTNAGLSPSVAIPATPPQQVAQTTPSPASTTALRSLQSLADRLAARDQFSGVVLVARPDGAVFERSFGLADREAKIAVRADTQFALASIGKLFTSTAIHQLVEQGKVSLDAPIIAYLPDYPNKEAAAKITVRQLLSHQSGFGNIDIFGPEHVERRLTLSSPAQFIAYQGNRAPEFEPGSRVAYSNYAFVLLGRIIEKVSGEEYEAYLAKHIFASAGMTHTGFPLFDQRGPDIAVGYTGENYAEATAPGANLVPNGYTLPKKGSAAGGAYASAGDMLKFVNALESGKLLKRETLAAALVPQKGPFGLGFMVIGEGKQRQWGHQGGAWGMNTDLRVLADGTRVIVLANRDGPVANKLASTYSYFIADPDGTTPVLVRGTMNDWGQQMPLTKQTDGSYVIEGPIPKGEYEFKLASADWATVDLGGTLTAAGQFPELGPGATLPLEFGGANIKLKLPTDGAYRLTLTGLAQGEPVVRLEAVK